jgi:hypothetical protein
MIECHLNRTDYSVDPDYSICDLAPTNPTTQPNTEISASPRAQPASSTVFTLCVVAMASHLLLI